MNVVGIDVYIDVEIGIGVVQEIDFVIGGEVDGVMVYWIVRISRYYCWQFNFYSFVVCVNVGGRCSGWIGLFVGYGCDYCWCDGGFVQLVDVDWVDGYFIFVWWVIVEVQFGEVYYQFFVWCIGQQCLQGDGQYVVGVWNIGVNFGIGLQQGQEVDIVFFGNCFQ